MTTFPDLLPLQENVNATFAGLAGIQPCQPTPLPPPRFTDCQALLLRKLARLNEWERTTLPDAEEVIADALRIDGLTWCYVMSGWCGDRGWMITADGRAALAEFEEGNG